MQNAFPEWRAVEGYSCRIVTCGTPRSMHVFTLPHTRAGIFLLTSLAVCIFWFMKAFKIDDKYTNITCTSNFTRALRLPIWPLGSFQPFSLPFAFLMLFPAPAQLKDRFILMHGLEALMKSAVKLPSCSCLAAVSDGHLSAASPSQTQTKGPLMGAFLQSIYTFSSWTSTSASV